MLFIQLFAASLLFHEALFLLKEGKRYALFCFLPALGLRLKPAYLLTTHIILIAISITLLFAPHYSFLFPMLLISLTLIIAAYSVRLSNHLILAWFIILVLNIDLIVRAAFHNPKHLTSFVQISVALLVILTYLLTFIHKLNHDYLNPKTSCGAILARLYLSDRGIHSKAIHQLLAWCGIYLTLSLELAVPILLLFPKTRMIALVLALPLHLFFGFLCHVHFSMLMFAGLSVFLNQQLLEGMFLYENIEVLTLSLITGGVLGAKFGLVSICKYKNGGRVLQILFGACAMMFALLLFKGGASQLTYSVAYAEGYIPLLTLIALLFLANGLSPYLGIKTEFSFAMFSNLRPDKRSHIIFRRPLIDSQHTNYVIIKKVEGLPEPASQELEWYDYVVLIALLKFREIKYSKYFFYSAISKLPRILRANARFLLVYEVDGITYTVNQRRDLLEIAATKHLKLGVVPFRLPLEIDYPYCE